MAFVGPLTSLLLGGLAYLLLLAIGGGISPLAAILAYLLVANLLLTPVGLTMIPLERLHTVTAQQSLNDALPLMVGQDVNQVPVVEDGRLVGMVSREDMMRFLEIRRGLGLEDRGK